MTEDTFTKEEALLAACYLTSYINGKGETDEVRFIRNVVRVTESLDSKVDLNNFNDKWATMISDGGLPRIEKEVIETLNDYPREYRAKAVAWMNEVAKVDYHRDEKEQSLLARTYEALHLSWSEVDTEIRKIRQIEE